MTTESKKFKVFFSYGREDDFAFVESVYDYLANQPMYEPWLDRKSLRSPEQFTADIERNIIESDCMLLFVGEYAANSEWCRREWTTARQHCKTIIPILVKHTFKDLADEIKDKYPKSIFSVDGVECPAENRTGSLERIFDKLERERKEPPKFAKVNWHPTEAKVSQHVFQERPETKELLVFLTDPKRISSPNYADAAVDTRHVLVTGGAGMGKSTLMQNFVGQCDTRINRQHVHYIEVGRSFERIDTLISEDVFSQLRYGYAVIILDDVWNRSLVDRFTEIENKKMTIYVVSRGSDIMSEIPADRRVKVGALDTKTGIEILKRYIKPKKGNYSNIEEEAFKRLLDRLKGHPLAISIAARILGNGGITIDEYMDELKENPQDDLQDVLQASLMTLESPGVREQFIRLSLLADIGLSSVFLRNFWGLADTPTARNWLTKIQSVGLIEAEGGSYHIHSLVQDYSKWYLKQQGGLKGLFEYHWSFWNKFIEESIEGVENKTAEENYEKYSRHLLYFFIQVAEEDQLATEFVEKNLELVTKLRDIAIGKNFKVSHKASIAFRGVKLAEDLLKRKRLING